jgi:hypothetical protein
MDNQILLIIIVVIVAALVIGAVIYSRRQRSQHLRSRFGPEYDRAVEEHGARGKAEADLRKLEKRVDKFDIKPLSTTQRDRFVVSWREIQAAFVDNPETAVTRADQLLGEVMEARGYPVGDFDQRAADLSVDHPVVVDNYRTAHEIALRHERGQATTEDLRQAMIHFRALFDELTVDRAVAPDIARPPPDPDPKPVRSAVRAGR